MALNDIVLVAKARSKITARIIFERWLIEQNFDQGTICVTDFSCSSNRSMSLINSLLKNVFDEDELSDENAKGGDAGQLKKSAAALSKEELSNGKQIYRYSSG